MRIRDFLAAVYDAFSRRVPKAYREHQWRIRFSLLQVYFGEPAIHYEVWVQRKTDTIEIGLHFEGEREENYRWAVALSQRALEIQAGLGPGVELEEWTQRWTRLHEQRPLAGGGDWKPSRDLTEELAQQVAERLARFIEVLEPIVAEEWPNVVGNETKEKKETKRRPARRRAGARRRRGAAGGAA